MSFGIIKCAKLRRGLVKTSVGSEDTAATLSLIANNSTHVYGVGQDCRRRGSFAAIEKLPCALCEAGSTRFSLSEPKARDLIRSLFNVFNVEPRNEMKISSFEPWTKF